MKTRKTILLTNDDGYNANGIQKLYTVLSKFFDVVIVAPESERSGVGHSFTYNKPIFYRKILNSYANEMYCVAGSPADCVKFAVSFLLKEKPDLIVSGLNIGENSGISAYYSGTVAAAREGSFWKIKSFAFSICEEGIDYSSLYANFVPEIINTLINCCSLLYNVNFPSCHPDHLKGLKITRQSLAFYNDSYVKIQGGDEDSVNEGFMLVGKKIDLESDDRYDSRALLNNWIAITPLSNDSTADSEIDNLKNIENNFVFTR